MAARGLTGGMSALTLHVGLAPHHLMGTLTATLICSRRYISLNVDQPQGLTLHLGPPLKGAYQIKTNPQMITGEASSNTFTGVFTFVRGLAVRRKIDGVNLAELIHEAQPYQKLIVIMREPVSRYYSAFHYYRRSSKAPFESPEKFHAKAVEDIKRWKACVEKIGSMPCLKRYDPQQLIKGMYSEFVEAWRAAFPPDQLLW